MILVKAKLPRARLLTLKEVVERVGLERRVVSRLVKQGQFPAPVRPVGTNAPRWLDFEITEYVHSLRVERDVAAELAAIDAGEAQTQYPKPRTERGGSKC
jgi:predicted DNA-binding transcriptional regulator AlpA